ncbi:MAG: type II secretion system protein [Bacteroidota bacterium]
MSRLAAFTILELTVAMAITAIVVSLSFGGFRLVQLQFRQFKDQQELTEEYRRCLTLLQWDAKQCEYMNQQGMSIRLWNQTDTIIYDVQPTYTIRHYALQHQDTFAVNLKILRSSFNEITPAEGLVDQVDFSVAMTDFVKRFHLSMDYSAEQLILWENED